MPTPRRPRPGAAAVPAVDALRADAAPAGPPPADVPDAARAEPEAAVRAAAAAPTDVLIGGDVDRIRALLAELFSLPAAEVREALGLEDLAAIAAAEDAAADEQRFAAAMADGLARLGWLIRRHPRLAPALQWELAGLTPQAVIPPDELAAIAATAAAVGASVGPARYARYLGPDQHATATVVELSPDAVRLVLTTVRDDVTAPLPAPPSAAAAS